MLLWRSTHDLRRRALNPLCRDTPCACCTQLRRLRLSRYVARTDGYISQDYAELHKVLQVGKAVAIDDGLLSLTVEAINGTDVVCRVNNTVMLGETKGINLVHLLSPRAQSRTRKGAPKHARRARTHARLSPCTSRICSLLLEFSGCLPRCSCVYVGRTREH